MSACVPTFLLMSYAASNNNAATASIATTAATATATATTVATDVATTATSAK